MAEFVSKVEEIMPATELNFPTTLGFGKWKKYFPEEAVKHPAKANLNLVEFLILEYTEKGDVILDPMAGTYSTCVLAALHGRHGIGVDIEDRFYQWGLEAKKRVEETQTLTEKGTIMVLKGDARKLRQVFFKGKVSAIITSPPYLKTAEHGAGINKQREGDVQIGCSTIGREVMDPDAIDNAREYGELEEVKPFSEIAEIYEKLKKNGKPTYLSEMLLVYNEMFSVLKLGGRAMIIVRPFIRKKSVVDLPYHSYLLMKLVGFELEKVYKLRLKAKSFWRILYEKKYPEVPQINHEYVLVARKVGGDEIGTSKVEIPMSIL